MSGWKAALQKMSMLASQERSGHAWREPANRAGMGMHQQPQCCAGFTPYTDFSLLQAQRQRRVFAAEDMSTPTNEKDVSTPSPSNTLLASSTSKGPKPETSSPIPTEQHPKPPSPYTLLTTPQRTLISLLAGLATMFSPLTANIYLPCLPLLQHDFSTTLQLMNLTITGYVLIQGISPALFSQLSETMGRRPVYLLTFSIFAAASVALASIPASYPALLSLRMLQSFGSSVSTSIGYAVVADISAPSERGKTMAPVLMMMNLGLVVAPVIGGPMCGSAGWRWVFWFLAIFGSAFLLVTALFLPETNRKIVSNGSIAAKGINRPPLRFLIPRSDAYEEPSRRAYPSKWSEVRAFAPNPFKSVVLVFQEDSACVLFAAGIFYMMYYVSQASLPALLKQAYGFSEAEIGLCYLTLGLGVFFGSQIQGMRPCLVAAYMHRTDHPKARVMDWNYKVTAKKIGWEVDNVRGDDLSRFPIEQARARLSWVFHILQCSFALAYGWAIHFRLVSRPGGLYRFLNSRDTSTLPFPSSSSSSKACLASYK